MRAYWMINTCNGLYEGHNNETLRELIKRIAIDAVEEQEELTVNEIYFRSNINEHYINESCFGDVEKELNNAIQRVMQHERDNTAYHKECAKLIYNRF